MKKSVILFIDTSRRDHVRVALESSGKRFEKSIETKPAFAQMVLPLIEDLLKHRKLSLDDISEIKIETGSGSFTGLRVGMAIANMLGTLLSVPVNGNLPGRVVLRYAPSKIDGRR